MCPCKLMKPGLLLGLLLAIGYAVGADVKLYDKAPSVEELRRQLTGNNVTSPSNGPKTRAIVFGNAAPTSQETAAMPPPAKTAAAQADQPAGQAGGNAIAFPIHFRINSSDILPESVPFLESIGGLMQKDPDIRLLVEGHTDSQGSAARNTTLSRERADSVVNYLVDRYRIEPARLAPVGKGSSEPLEGMNAANPKNRRVQFRITG